jgi:hypothetical protein
MKIKKSISVTNAYYPPQRVDKPAEKLRPDPVSAKVPPLSLSKSLKKLVLPMQTPIQRPVKSITTMTSESPEPKERRTKKQRSPK